MTVIDAQVHIRGAETPERPWPPGGTALAHRPTPLGKDELTQLRSSYRQAATLFTEERDFLSDIDTTWMMGRGIAAWLGWPL